MITSQMNKVNKARLLKMLKRIRLLQKKSFNYTPYGWHIKMSLHWTAGRNKLIRQKPWVYHTLSIEVYSSFCYCSSVNSYDFWRPGRAKIMAAPDKNRKLKKKMNVLLLVSIIYNVLSTEYVFFRLKNIYLCCRSFDSAARDGRGNHRPPLLHHCCSQ
jgi:hypothetical protein